MRDPFRLEINGLRALAVAAVLLFHFEFPGLRGGFVGVDVFFVISGYLMTRIIAGRLERGRFSILEFWLARARRIIPALAVVCIALMVVGYFALAPRRFAQLGDDVATSMEFGSNIAYLQEAGYFAPGAHQKFLLHTWSLSAEWQFYLCYPLFLLVLWRLPPSVRVGGVAVSCLASFLASALGLAESPEASFYLLPTRAWEMLLGALVCQFPGRPGKAQARVMEALGAVLIVASVLLLDPLDVWPGWKAAFPAAGAGLVILAARGEETVLRAAPAQWLGRVSYSTYLWHWPVVVWLAQQDRLAPVGWKLAGLAVSLLLGGLSYRWIERPAQERTSALRLRLQAGAIAAASVSVAALGTVISQQDGLPGRMLPGYGRIVAQLKLPTVDNGWCFYSVDTIPRLQLGAEGTRCSVGASGAREAALLFGDSFAGHSDPLWAAVAQREGVRIRSVSTNWCYPALDDAFTGPPAAQRSRAQCALNRSFLKQALGRYPVVILAGYWRAVFAQHQEQSLFDAIDAAAARSRLVLVMAAPASFDVDVADSWAHSLLAGDRFDIGSLPNTSDDLTRETNARIATYVGKHPNVIFLDRKALFSVNGHVSNVTAENIPFSLEGVHLSIYGSQAAARSLQGSAHYERIARALRAAAAASD